MQTPNQKRKTGRIRHHECKSSFIPSWYAAWQRGGLLGSYALAPRYGLAADIPYEFDGSEFQMAAPEPNPKRGGVMRYGILNRPPHFDMHQSGTVGNIGTQGCMFDNLIRRDPRDSGKTIVPDLAHSWEIAKDGKTYTFHLRKGVQFHDGTEFTSADVKATYRPHLQAAAWHQHPAQRAVHGGGGDQHARQVHRSSSSCPRRAPSTS